MVIINLLKKTISALMALTISAASIGAISADAYGITYRNDSEFKYEVSARIVSDTQIELKIDVTNNPGFYELGFVVHYEGCTPSYDYNVKHNSEVLQNLQSCNPELQNWVYNSYILDYDSRAFDYDGNFTLCCYFDVDNAYEDICKFSTSVALYRSNNENISFNIMQSKDLNKYFEPPIKADEISYMVGDMDNNSIIEISDASAINRLVSFTENKQGIELKNLNAIISHGAWDNSYNPNDFASEFPNLLCAEVADANDDKHITLADSEEVLTCYANDMVSIPYEGLVGKVDIKEIIVLA